jgi:hypothetical protein
MTTETIKLNAENWIDGMIEITVDTLAGIKSWVQNEETVSLANRWTTDDDDPKYAWEQFDILIDGRDTGWRVGKFISEEYWMASDEDGDICRQDRNPAAAAAKLVAMCS